MAESGASLFEVDLGGTARSLDEKTLRYIASQLGHEWQKYGTFLGVSVAEMQRLEQDYPSRTEDQIFNMQVSFQNKHPLESYQSICSALTRCGRRDIVLDLKKSVHSVSKSKRRQSDSSQENERLDSTETSGIETGYEVAETSGDTKPFVHDMCHKCLLPHNEHQQEAVLKKKKRRRTRKSLKKRDERRKLQAISNVAYLSLRRDLRKAFSSNDDLQDLKELTEKDNSQHGISLECLQGVTTVPEFLTCLEENYLFGEDILYFVKYLACSLKSDEAINAIDNYAHSGKSLPLVLRTVQKRTHVKGKKLVEYHISGDFKHAKMKNVNQFIKTISQRLRIPRRHINLVGSSSGSIILVFLLPEEGVTRLKDALSKKDAWLIENNVLDVHIEGEECVRIKDWKDNTDAKNVNSKENKEFSNQIPKKLKSHQKLDDKSAFTDADKSDKLSKEQSSLHRLLRFILPKWAHKIVRKFEQESRCTKVSYSVTCDTTSSIARVFILYSEDHQFHKECIRRLAIFLERVCNCEVVLDMWESNDMKIGDKSWLYDQISTADKVLIISSKGTVCKSFLGMELTDSENKTSEVFGSTFLTGYRIASDEFSSNPTLLSSKYVFAYFEYSENDKLQDMQNSVTRYEIPTNLEQLYFQLHDIKQYTPRSSRRVLNLAPDAYATVGSEGPALQQAIDDMKRLIKSDPHWYENGPETDIVCCTSVGDAVDGVPDQSFFQYVDDDTNSTFSECFEQICTDRHNMEQSENEADSETGRSFKINWPSLDSGYLEF